MIARDTVIRQLSTWITTRLTGRRAEREDIVMFLAKLSPEERSGVWKLRMFYNRHSRGKKRVVAPRDSSVHNYGSSIEWEPRVYP